MKEYYRVQANINLDAIYDNFLHAKQLLKPETKLMAIIKADAYGHGAIEVAHTIDELADAYGVAILEEGVELRKAGITKPMLILGYTARPQYSAMIDYEIDTAVFTLEMAEELSEIAVKKEKTAGTAKSKYPSASRNRGYNRIFTQDCFKRGGLFQYQAQQYFGNVRGEPVGKNLLILITI